MKKLLEILAVESLVVLLWADEDALYIVGNKLWKLNILSFLKNPTSSTKSGFLFLESMGSLTFWKN